MDKKELLSHITVEEFEEILDNFVNKLIIGLRSYNHTINVSPTIPSPPLPPRYDFFQPWCDDSSNVWFSDKDKEI